MQRRWYYYLAPRLMELGLTRREAVKIIAQVEADRHRRELYSPEFARVKALHDGIYRLICDARQAQDYDSEALMVPACNELYRRMYHVVIGDPLKECQERATNLLCRRSALSALERSK